MIFERYRWFLSDIDDFWVMYAFSKIFVLSINLYISFSFIMFWTVNCFFIQRPATLAYPRHSVQDHIAVPLARGTVGGLKYSLQWQITSPSDLVSEYIFENAPKLTHTSFSFLAAWFGREGLWYGSGIVVVPGVNWWNALDFTTFWRTPYMEIFLYNPTP